MSRFEDRYEMLGLLGSGGQASVFRAHDRALGRDVAVKLLPGGQPDGQTAARFQRECEVLARVAHPAIVPVLEWGRTGDGVLYLTMPLLAGAESLAALVRAGRTAPPRLTPECRQVLRDVAEGLDLLHARGFFHRDIKPSNILVVPPARGVIIDFGLVRVANQAMTATGVAPCTPAFASPELATFDTVQAPSDQFQLGLVAYHLIADCEPVTDPAEFTRRASCGQPPMPLASTRHPGVSPFVDEVLRRVTAADPARRYPTCRAFVDALFAALDAAEAPDQQTALEPPGRAASPVKPSRRLAAGDRLRPFAAALIGVALALLAWLVRPAATPVALSDVRVERGLHGLTVRFRRTPPGRAAVTVTAAGRTRVVTSAAESEQHVVRVAELGEAGEVTLQASAGLTAAPAVTVAWAPVRVESVSATATLRGLAVRFSTSLPVRARVAVVRASEAVPAPGQDTMETAHQVLLSPRLMPFYPLLRVELGNGAETAAHEVKLEAGARQAWLDVAARWFAEQAEGYWKRYLVISGRPPVASDLEAAAQRMDAELPPAWLVDEVGGAGGALEMLEVGDRARELWTAVRRVAALNALRDALGIRARYPIEKLFGLHRGWSEHPHYPRARVVALAGAELTGGQIGSTAVVVPRELPAVAGGARAELHARAVLPPGRALEVDVGGCTVDLAPVGGRTTGAVQDLYAAFDAACLRPGVRLTVRCARITDAVESLRPRPGPHLEALELRIEE